MTPYLLERLTDVWTRVPPPPVSPDSGGFDVPGLGNNQKRDLSVPSRPLGTSRPTKRTAPETRDPRSRPQGNGPSTGTQLNPGPFITEPPTLNLFHQPLYPNPDQVNGYFPREFPSTIMEILNRSRPSPSEKDRSLRGLYSFVIFYCSYYLYPHSGVRGPYVFSFSWLVEGKTRGPVSSVAVGASFLSVGCTPNRGPTVWCRDKRCLC